MATFQNTAGTSDFTETRDSIITRALRICGAIADEELPNSTMLANATQALNAMVKQWDAMGIHVWTESEGVIFLQPLQNRYQLNDHSSPDHAAQKWRLSSLASSLSIGATTISLSTIYDYDKNDIAIGDHIGIVLDSGTVFWALVSYPNPLAIDTALTGAAAATNPVFIYTDKIQQPLRIPASRRFILSNQVETPLLRYARLDYQEQSNKISPGTITSYFYDPQLNTGYYYLWPNPSDVAAIVKFTWYRRLQDFTDATDTPDLPQEWANPLTWNLAKEIGPEYDVPLQKYQGIILARAAETLDMVQGFDRESESIFFGLSVDGPSR